MTPSDQSRGADVLVELARRCEAATAGDTNAMRALGREVLSACGKGFVSPLYAWLNPVLSLDAAVTILPAKALWYVNSDGVGSTASVCCVRADGSLIHGACPTVEGNTPALALTAAALLARAHGDTRS